MDALLSPEQYRPDESKLMTIFLVMVTQRGRDFVLYAFREEEDANASLAHLKEVPVEGSSYYIDTVDVA